MPNDENIYRIITSRAPVVTGAEPTEPEWNDLQGRVGALEDDPRLLAELDDVNPAGGAGTVLIKQADGTFAFGQQVGSINRIANAGTDESAYNVNFISLRDGLRFVQSGQPDSGTVFIEAITGTTAGTLARGNHAHQLLSRFVEPITPGAYMSGGTRQLAARNVTLPAGKACRVTATIDMQLRGGDPGPCYFRYHLSIDGNTRTSGAGTNGYWVVQGVPGGPSFSHIRTITGTGSAITVSASVSYYDGGGFYTDAGDLVIDVNYDR